MDIKIKFEELNAPGEIVISAYAVHENGKIPLGDPNKFLYRAGDELVVNLPEDQKVKINTIRKE